MFNFNLGMLDGLEEKIALAQAAGLIPQPQQQPSPQPQQQPVAAPVRANPQPAMQPMASPAPSPVQRPMRPGGRGLDLGGPQQIPQNPYVAPPTPQQPIPPASQPFMPEVSPPEQAPSGIMTGQTLPPTPIEPSDDVYANAQDRAADSPTDVWVSGENRYDEDGLTQMQRLDLLNNANNDLIPEGRTQGKTNSPMIQLAHGGLNPGPQALNPDYQAGAYGNTIGGVGNTDAWGNDVNWSKPKYGNGELGQVVSTPAGDYVVVNGAEGNLALMPLDGAVTNGNAYFYNFTSGKHHVGIDPVTGNVWYQEAAGYTNFSGGTYENPNGPGYNPTNNPGGTNPDGGGNPNGGGDPVNNANPSASNGSGSTWKDLVNRQGKDIESWDRWMGMFTGLDDKIDWSGLNEAGVIDKFNGLPNGLFEGLDRNEILQRLLKNLGLA